MLYSRPSSAVCVCVKSIPSSLIERYFINNIHRNYHHRQNDERSGVHRHHLTERKNDVCRGDVGCFFCVRVSDFQFNL